MPTKPKNPCRAPGCPALCELGKSYCPKHQKEFSRSYERARGTPSQRGYGVHWQKLRAWFLSQPENLFCFDCKRNPSTEVHHLRAIADGGTNDSENLIALCKGCHSARTMRNTLKS